MANKSRSLPGACAALLVLLAAGCGDPKPQAPAAAPPEEKKKEAEKPPPLLGEAASGEAGIEVLFDPNKAPEKPADTYEVDENLHTGIVRGVVRLVGLKDRPRNPPKLALELSGAHAIHEPQADEVKFYENIRMEKELWVTHDFSPLGAVLFIRDIRRGKLPVQERPTVMAKKGHIHVAATRSPVTTGPTGELVQIGTWDKFPCQFSLTDLSTQEQLYSGEVSYSDNWKPGDWLHAAPNFILSKPMKKPGPYKISCKRHPWQLGFVYINDNPYVWVANGKFEMGKIPVGTHKLEVWHPVFKPAQEAVEIEIKKDEVTEIFVDLTVPDHLKDELLQEAKKK